MDSSPSFIYKCLKVEASIESRALLPFESKRIFEHTDTASGPLTLMIPIPDSDNAVEIAAIVVEVTSAIFYKKGQGRCHGPVGFKSYGSISSASASVVTSAISGRLYTFFESNNNVSVGTFTLTVGIYIIVILKCGMNNSSLIRIH